MIYILNIGYRSYAFKSMRGLQSVMDALGKALPLKQCYWPGCERDNFARLEVDDRPLEVGLHCVPGISFRAGKPGAGPREVIEPEVMPRERPARTGRTPAAMQLKAAQYDLPQPAEWGRVTSGRPRLEIGEGT